MPRRHASFAQPRRAAVVDAEAARAAISRVASERDRERAERLRLEAKLAELAEERKLHEKRELQVQHDPQEAHPDTLRAQQLAADLANLRRHTEASIERGVRRETTRILSEVASLHDTVDRALQASPHASGPWVDGLVAIRSKVDAVVRREGLSLVGQVGERFDPALHEAAGTTPGSPAGRVAAVISSGLRLASGAVAQPARVIVTE